MLKKNISKLICKIVLIILIIGLLFPIYWMVGISLKNKSEIFTYPPTLVPQQITMDNYLGVLYQGGSESVVLGEGGYYKYLRNSLIVAIISSMICLALGAFGSYGLVRLKASQRLKRNISFWIISTRMIPPVAAAIPFYIMFRNLRMLNNLTSLIIVYTSMNLPFSIWILQGFFREVPSEIYEAATIDGCSPVAAFVKVVLPLSMPGLMTSLIFTTIFSWNEFLFALILTGEETKTMPVAAASMWSAISSRWGEIASVGVVTIIPVLILTLLTQKHFVQGMTFGAIK